MEFKLFTYDYYLKMIHKIVPRNFKVGIADYEDLYQELLIYILSVEDKLITNKVEVYRDLESYMFTQVFHRCKRLINQLTKRKTFEDINYEVEYDDIPDETIFEEEVLGRNERDDSSGIHKTMVRFLGSIIIALAIEALMLVFKYAIIDSSHILNAVYLIGGVTLLLFGLAFYLKAISQKRDI